MIVQFYGKTPRDTIDGLIIALRIIRKEGGTTQVAPIEAKKAIATGFWVRGTDKIVEDIVSKIMGKARQQNVKIEPSEYIG